MWNNLWGDLSDENGSMNAEEEEEHGIALTVGFVPGLKVDVIPLLRSTKVSDFEKKNDLLRSF